MNHLVDQWRTATGQLRFRDETYGASGGQRDSSVYAIIGDETVGQIDYSVFEGVVGIKHIEVHEAHRREGIATKMWAYMRGVENNKPIDPGMFTPDGSKWWGGINPSLKGKIVHYDPEVGDYVESSKLAFGPVYNGIPVDQLRPSPEDEHWTVGRIAGRNVIAYRGFGTWRELIQAKLNDGWKSTGTFTIRGEGDTQVTMALQDVLSHSGKHQLRRSGFVGAIAVDIGGLRFSTHVGMSWDGPSRPFFALDEDGRSGKFYPDMGLGLGIIGRIPLDRIKRVYVIEDKKIVSDLAFYQAYEHAQAGTFTTPEDWQPEVRDLPESYVRWYGYESGKPPSKSPIHVFTSMQRGWACGTKMVMPNTVGRRVMNTLELAKFLDENPEIRKHKLCPKCFPDGAWTLFDEPLG